jgi:hypothetical protein
MPHAATPDTRSSRSAWKPPHARRGDLVVVEDPPQSKRFAVATARLCVDGDLITYTLLGKPDHPDHWHHRHSGQRFSVVATGEPDDQAQAERRAAFCEAAGKLEGSAHKETIQRLLDAHKPL